AIPVYRWSRLAIVPAAHPLTRLGRPLQLQDLDGLPLVSYESSLRPDSSLQQAFRSQGLKPQLACTSSDADLIKTYVRSGLGVGLLAEMALGQADRQDLTILDSRDLLPECTTWLVLRRDRVLRGYSQALVGGLAPH